MSAFEDDERFDGLYLNVAQTTRGIEPLLDTVFSFLRRKTDFFAGPPGSEDGTAAAIAKVNQVLQKHAKKYEADHPPKKTKMPASKPAKKEEPKKEEPKKKEEEEEVIEMGQDGEFDISEKETPAKQQQSSAPAPAPAKESETPKVEETTTKSDDTKTEDPESADDDAKKETEKPPLGNGGTVEGKYVWTQTLSEVTVTLPVPDNTRGRDLNVTIARTKLKVGVKGSTPILDAPLCKTIIVDDSFWTVEDGNRLVLQLQKLNQMEWWDCVCQGEPSIDVTKIQPESSNISDLDGETQKTVAKMMHDQRQKAMGLPTSDEQVKLDALERFKKQHPELDFSNAKIS